MFPMLLELQNNPRAILRHQPLASYLRSRNLLHPPPLPSALSPQTMPQLFLQSHPLNIPQPQLLLTSPFRLHLPIPLHLDSRSFKMGIQLQQHLDSRLCRIPPQLLLVAPRR